jgi:hypothetical protein
MAALKLADDIRGMDAASKADACCVAVTAATCADWGMTGMFCEPDSQMLDSNPAAPADSTDGTTLKSETFQATCCGPVPKTCTTVMTKFTGGCGEGMHMKHSEVKLEEDPADAADFKKKCCEEEHEEEHAEHMCSHWAAWVAAEATNGGCKADGAKAYFDATKFDVKVSGDNDTDVTAACCTSPLSAMKCADHVMRGKACPTGLVADSMITKELGDSLTQADFEAECCVAPAKCSEYTGEVGPVANAATSHSAVLMQLAILGAMRTVI